MKKQNMKSIFNIFYVSILVIILVCLGSMAFADDQIACTDTDNGRDYSIKGLTSGLDVLGHTYLERSDVCIATGNGAGLLTEFYCGKSSTVSYDVVLSENYNCPNGCSDGACISKVECKADSDCPPIPCNCIVGINCNCPVNKCIDGKCVQVVPTYVSEIVTCNFPDATQGYECSSDYGACYAQPRRVCSNPSDPTTCRIVTQCNVEVRGEKGTKIKWNAMSCGGTGISVIDGVDETVNFKCIYEQPKCVETDSGKDIFNKGETKYGAEDEVDFCIDKGTLDEYFCAGDGILDSKITCENGCLDGACVQPKPFCSDSDGGINYNQYGEVTTMSGVKVDKCSETAINVLTENYCEGDNPSTITYACPYGCARGVCLGKITETDKCVFYDANETERCYSKYGNCIAHPDTTGIATCTVDVEGKSGEKVDWQSSCGGNAKTVIDGLDEKAEFKCHKDTIKDIVKCIFHGSTVPQKCYTAPDNNRAGCTGSGQCDTEIKGVTAEQVTWKSSCGGYIQEIIDGHDDVLDFYCDTVSESVKCVFHGSSQEQRCYTAGDNNRAGCSGKETCVTNINGFSGEQITWKSTCGGYDYTTIDGDTEYAEFFCSGSNSTSSIYITLKENEQTGYSSQNSNWSIILNSIVDNSDASYISLELSLDDENKHAIKLLKVTDTVEYKGLIISLLSISTDNNGQKIAKLRLREAVAQVSSIQLGTAVHVSTDLSTETTATSVPSMQITSENDCQGCFIDGKCIPYGIRTKNGEAKYCELSGKFELQKEENSECSNNFECVSNYCSNGKCVNIVDRIEKQQGMLEKISSWLKTLLGLA